MGCRNRVVLFFTLLVFLSLVNGQQESSAEDVSPFFFSCKQYNRFQNNWDESSNRVAQVELAGNPRSYIGGKVYKGIERVKIIIIKLIHQHIM